MSEKQCTSCGEVKPLTEYYNRRLKAKDGKNSHCKDCENAQIAVWRAANKDKQALINRKTRLKTTYGLTMEQYDELLEKQNGCCAICGRHHTIFKVRLAVDHNHTTNEIRGLCCTYCNHRVVGRHKDPELLRKVANYLEQGTGWFVPEKPKRRKRSHTPPKPD